MFTIIMWCLAGFFCANIINSLFFDVSWLVENKNQTIKMLEKEIKYLRGRENYLKERVDNLYGMLQDAEKELQEKI